MKDLDLDTASRQYLSEHVNDRCAAPERAEYAIKHLCGAMGGLMISALSPEILRQYARSRKVSDGTLRRELGVLRSICTHAIKERRLDRNLTPHIDMPPEPPPRDRWLTQTEVTQLLDSCEFEIHRINGKFRSVRVGPCTRIHLFVTIAVNTAARKAAIENLKWCQVDLERRVISFKPEGEAQTKKRRPVVPISDKLYGSLVAAKQEATTEYVLGNNGDITKSFKTSVNRAGLSKVTPHTLRHTWATLAAMHGIPIWDIAGVLGDDEGTVRKRYAHHCPEYLRDAVNFMD